MPGLIGKAYAEMGGTVHYVGKPHPAVYEACFKALQVNLSLDSCQRVSMVSAEYLIVYLLFLTHTRYVTRFFFHRNV